MAAHAFAPRSAVTRATSLSGLDERDGDDVLAEAHRFASDLQRARIVVTGATGWFGTWLLDALVMLNRHLSLDLRIVAVSRDPEAFAKRHPMLHAAAEIEWIGADLREPQWTMPGPVTHIVHAANDSAAGSDVDAPDRLFETIFTGTRNVLALAARERGAKLLLLGSGAVYGPSIDAAARFGETDRSAPDPLDPSNEYAEGKRAAESIAAVWHAARDVDVKIARCFAFVGPHMPFDAHFAIGNFIRDGIERDEIVVRGDGTPLRSYQYMSDLVVWLLTILVQGRAMRPYNVGSADAVAIATLARTAANATGRRVRVRIEGRAGLGHHYVPDVSRARVELGLSNRVSLDAAMSRTSDWFRAYSTSRSVEGRRQ